MSKKLFTPVNQVRFTNVAVVRLKRGGKRFEIAAYKNKVIEWRNKITTDLDEVLQTPTIFTNVSKGVVAKKELLEKCFGTRDKVKICEMILEKGEMQVSGEERKQQYETLFNDIATIVAEKCINPETGRPLTAGMVKKAMKDIHFSVNPSRNAKQQALDVIRLLKEKPDFPIARAQMRLRILLPFGPDTDAMKEAVKPLLFHTEREEKVGTEEEESRGKAKLELIALVDPSNFRSVEETVKKATRNRGGIELLAMAVHEEGDEKLE